MITTVSLVTRQARTIQVSDEWKQVSMKVSSSLLFILYTVTDRLMWRSYNMSDGTSTMAEDLSVEGVLALAPSHQKTSTFTAITSTHVYKFFHSHKTPPTVELNSRNIFFKDSLQHRFTHVAILDSKALILSDSTTLYYLEPSKMLLKLQLEADLGVVKLRTLDTRVYIATNRQLYVFDAGNTF